ncbi:hypothetical protein [Botryobacter ruber]|uniref:hypothetical protein n=1 Tax=Botryobacter ruber TaxID=2171629 RepID=UPI000E0A87E4|nr:hypothetical protein [Botryobacter ruber]
MEELRKLLEIVTFCEQNDFTDFEFKESGKESTLITNIVAGKYQTDADAAQDLYDADQNDVRYKMLKHRLKKKLFKMLFFFDFTKTKLKGYFRDEQECKHFMHHAEVLIRQGEYQISKRLLNKALLISKRLEFTNLVVSILRSRMVIEVETGTFKDYLKTKEELDDWNLKLLNETEAQNLFYTVKLNLNKSVNARKQFLPLIPDMLLRLEELWNTTHTYVAFEMYYKVNLWFYELTGDFKQIITITDKTESWLQQGLINKFRFDLRYHKFIIVYAHLRAKLLEDGLKYAGLYKQDFDPNFPNWFSYMENYFLLAIHANQYEQAQQLISEVFNNTALQKIMKAARERWALYRAYLNFVHPTNFLGEAFKFNEFAAKVPDYSKDKQGFNVAILVLQFMYYLQKGDAEALLYRIESIKKYVLVHLKDSFSSRSRLFLKLLILTVVENFDAETCRLKGHKYYEKLITTPPPGDAYAEIEIIPYEHLWKLVLDILEKDEV